MDSVDAMSDVVAGLRSLAKFAVEDPATYERAVCLTDSIGLLRLIYDNRELFRHISINPTAALRICDAFERVKEVPAPVSSPAAEPTPEPAEPIPEPVEPLPATTRGRRAKPPPIDYVYFISAIPYSGRVKIGRSWDPVRRVDQLKTARDDRLRLSAVIPTHNGNELEDELHRLYSARRTHGEWFTFTHEELDAAVVDALNRAKPYVGDAIQPVESSLQLALVEPTEQRAIGPSLADAPKLVPRGNSASPMIIMGNNVTVNTGAKPMSDAKQRRLERVAAFESWVENNAPGATEPSGAYHARCMNAHPKPHMVIADFTALVEKSTGLRLVRNGRSSVWRDPDA